MKRPPPTEPGCISRRLPPPLLVLLLPATLLHLSGAEVPLPLSASPSGRRPLPLPAQPRTSSARSHQAAWLEKRLLTVVLSENAGTAWLSGKQPAVSPRSRRHLRALPSHGLEHHQLGSGPLRQISWTANLRRKRHAGARLHHAQLMRVGCSLGTCQVQNLSHRLWQLKGQSGRQDSSPMNPNSPHSYG